MRFTVGLSRNAFVFLSFMYGIATANDIYIAQNAAGTANGSSCGNAYSYTFFNSSGNWGTGSNQIGPGSTVHICGTITFPAGTAGLVAQGSGASGNPVKILFESGAILQSPYFLNGGANAGGAINLANKSYIIIDGGSDGIIQNTGNGTSGSYPNQAPTIGINADNSNTVTIQNLTIQNMYVRTSTSDSSVDQTQLNSIHAYPVNNFVINNVTLHDAGWHLAVYGNNVTISNSNIYNMDHGLSAGLGSTGYSGLYIYGNHFHDMSRWDDTTGANPYHHDAIHLWGTSGSGGWSNVYIYNNRFDGNAGMPGGGANGWIYFEYVIGPTYIFNNVLTSSPGTSFPSELGPFGGTTTQLIANNTMFGYGSAGCTNPGATGFASQSPGITLKNNIFADQYVTVYIKEPGGPAPGGFNNNVYGNTSIACGGSAHTWSFQGTDTQSLATWQAASGGDAQAVLATASQINLSSNGVPQAGSVALNAGANLTSLCSGTLVALCSDITGKPRPTSGPWDAGAYEVSSGGVSSGPAAPTNVTVTVY